MLTIFFAIAFGLAWLITVPIALQTQGLIDAMILPPVLQWAIGFTPLLAALWVVRRQGVSRAFLADALRIRVAGKWYLFALGLPWLVLLLSLALRSLAGIDLPTLRIGPSLAIFALIWLLLAFGEEAGWRAFSLPRLITRLGFWRASLLLGLLWCVWHYPKLFASPYMKLDMEGMRWLLLFSVQIVIANFLICWLFVRTRSAVICAVFHAGFNVIATAHYAAAVDLWLTGSLALVTAAILALDRRSLATSGQEKSAALQN